MVTVLALALPFSLIYMAVSGQLTWQGFVAGYVVSAIVLQIGQAYKLNFKPTRAIPQTIALFLYSARLAWDIFVSSVEVAKMVLSPDMSKEIDPGVLKISTQDKDNNEIVTALSSHGITITPGQIVIDITKEDGETYMHVHNLNVTRSRDTIISDQTTRLKLIRRILGYD